MSSVQFPATKNNLCFLKPQEQRERRKLECKQTSNQIFNRKCVLSLIQIIVMIKVWENNRGRNVRSVLITEHTNASSSYNIRVCTHDDIMPYSYQVQKSLKGVKSLVCEHKKACFTECRILSLEMMNIHRRMGLEYVQIHSKYPDFFSVTHVCLKQQTSYLFFRRSSSLLDNPITFELMTAVL